MLRLAKCFAKKKCLRKPEPYCHCMSVVGAGGKTKQSRDLVFCGSGVERFRGFGALTPILANCRPSGFWEATRLAL